MYPNYCINTWIVLGQTLTNLGLYSTPHLKPHLSSEEAWYTMCPGLARTPNMTEDQLTHSRHTLPNTCPEPAPDYCLNPCYHLLTARGLYLLYLTMEPALLTPHRDGYTAETASHSQTRHAESPVVVSHTYTHSGLPLSQDEVTQPVTEG